MMLQTNYHLVYPEGDQQEISRPLQFGDLVGVNGIPLTLPPGQERILAYRVYKIKRDERKGENNHFFFLEQLSPDEIASLG